MRSKVSRRRFLRSISAVCAGAASLAVAGCAVSGHSPGATMQPNVLLIVSEDHGPHLGCYGDRSARTPNLDRLAQEGIRYTRAYITYSVCSPSRSSILTGLYPHQNGQIGLATHKYAMFEAYPNLPGLLKGAGYRTGIIGKLHLNPESAFPFDFRWNDGRQISFNHRDVRRIAEEAGAFIAASREPFFLMVNYPDAHFNLLEQYRGIPEVPQEADDVAPLPFVGVDTPRIREYVADYYNCISRLDTGVGLLLSELERSGKADETVVIFLSDHGAQFSRGKCTCYEGGVHVPLILRWPGQIPEGRVRNELVSAIDLFPTIMDAATDGAVVSVPGGLHDDLPGRSLAPLNRGETVPWRRYVFCEKDGSAPFWFFPRRSIRDDRYKLIRNLIRDRPDPIPAAYATGHNTFFHAGAKAEEIAASPAPIREAYRTWEEAPPVELYDLEQDPNEFENLAGRPEYGEVQRRLLAALKAWQEETRDPLRDPEKLALLKKEMDTVVRDKVNYRKEKSFRWKYLDYLRTR